MQSRGDTSILLDLYNTGVFAGTNKYLDAPLLKLEGGPLYLQECLIFGTLCKCSSADRMKVPG